MPANLPWTVVRGYLFTRGKPKLDKIARRQDLGCHTCHVLVCPPVTLFQREKTMKRLVAVALCFLCVGPVSAQLSREQKFHDFQNLAALYAKRYAPYEWKRAAFGFDLYDIGPWLNR